MRRELRSRVLLFVFDLNHLGTDAYKRSKAAVESFLKDGALASDLIGVVAGGRAELNLGPVVTRQIKLQAITGGSTEQFFDMLAAIAQNEMKPVVDSTYALDELPAALARLKSGQHFGKVCVEI